MKVSNTRGKVGVLDAADRSELQQVVYFTYEKNKNYYIIFNLISVSRTVHTSLYKICGTLKSDLSLWET